MNKEMKRNVVLFVVMSVVGAIIGAVLFVSKSWFLFAIALTVFSIGFIGLMNLEKEYQEEQRNKE